MIEWFISKLLKSEVILLAAFSGAVIYVLVMRNEPIKQRLMSSLAGFIAAVVFAQPLADALSGGRGAYIYSATIAMCGQFVPVLIQATITKIKHTDVYDFLKRFFQK